MDMQERKFRKMISVLQRARPGPFLDGGIRVRMTLPDATVIYIDDAGGAIIGSSRVKLGKYDFVMLKRVFHKLAKRHGIRALD